MNTVMINILQGSVVTQIVLGGLTVLLTVANFLYFPKIMKVGWQ